MASPVRSTAAQPSTARRHGWHNVSSSLRGQGRRGTDRPAELPGAGEAYPATLVVEIAKPEGDPGGILDQAVRALGGGVRDAGLEEGEDLGPPGVDGLGEPTRLRHVGEGGGLVEAVQPVRNGVPIPGREQLAQPFLDAPGGADLVRRVV